MTARQIIYSSTIIVLGDFQAVLYSAVLEMCGLFIICIMIDAIQQQIEDICEM